MYSMYFPLETALNLSQRFWYVVPSFLLVSKNIFISAFISSLIQSTFKSQLFSFHEAVQFWVSFWILSSNLIALWSESVCYDFHSFAFAEEWFTSNYVVNFREGVMWCWEYIFSGFGVESSINATRFAWSRPELKSWIFLLIFCLVDLILTMGC